MIGYVPFEQINYWYEGLGVILGIICLCWLIVPINIGKCISKNS